MTIRGDLVSRLLSAAVVRRLMESKVDVRVTYRDLATGAIPHLSGSYLGALSGGGITHSAALQHDLAVGAEVLDEFLTADIVVIGVAFYNFTIASQLKTWIDRIVIAGKTFRYTEKGLEGLAGDKRLILAIARGGIYGPESPMRSYEHAESYLRAVFGSIGIVQPDVVVAEGIAIGPDQREAAIRGALEKVAGLPIAA